MLHALTSVVDSAELVAVINTADDTNLHGLAISPDIDTVTYTLAGAIDRQRGWGLGGETWEAMGALARFEEVRPPGSQAATTWFNLGDRDLATHLYRTARLAEGASLTAVTAEIATAFDVRARLLPMSDDRVRTMVTLDGGEEIPFQEYFVRLRHAVAVRAIRFDGAERAALSDHARAALTSAEVVVIAPSNPLVSIAPIRALAGVDELLAERRASVVAVSPIVGGQALKGPADRLLGELGIAATSAGVASLYSPIAATMVIDTVDASDAPAVAQVGMRPIVTPTVMAVPGVARSLAEAVLAAGRGTVPPG